jgi:hypothetical protein
LKVSSTNFAGVKEDEKLFIKRNFQEKRASIAQHIIETAYRIYGQRYTQY